MCFKSVLDNAYLHRNVVDYCNQKNINCAFISLDQEKAFYKIVHKCLLKVLEKFNFGPTINKMDKPFLSRFNFMYYCQ